MEYLLTCKCGREHTVSRSQAGQVLACECGQDLQVPTLRGITNLPLARAEGGENTPRSAWKGWRAPAMAICSTICVVAFLFSAYSFVQSLRNDLNYTTEDFIAEGNAAIDEFGPDELSITWTDFQNLGLRRRTAPIFHVYNVYSREQKIKGFIGLGVTAVFALLAATVWISAGFARKQNSSKQ